jgi:hypothetical protein
MSLRDDVNCDSQEAIRSLALASVDSLSGQPGMEARRRCRARAIGHDPAIARAPSRLEMTMTRGSLFVRQKDASIEDQVRQCRARIDQERW